MSVCLSLSFFVIVVIGKCAGKVQEVMGLAYM